MPSLGPPIPETVLTKPWPQVLEMAHQYPDREAVVAPTGRMTYQEMTQRVFQHQRGLESLGLTRGDRVAAMLGNDWSYLVLYWAVLASGMVFVPLNTKLARPEVAEIMQDAEPQLVITEDALIAQLPETGSGQRMALSQFHRHLQDASTAPLDASPALPEDVALILYTSGTTGRPKGVMLTHANIAYQFYQSTSTLVGINPGDRVVSLYPLFHSAQHVFLQAPLTVGATAVIDEFSPKRVHQLLKEEHVTVFFGVPAMYHILLQDPTFLAVNFPDIRILTYGASLMPMETIQTIKNRFPHAPIKNLYGQTENSPAISGLDGEYALTKPGSVGRPLPGMTIAVFDDDDHELPSGVVGEVVTQGVNLMKGYYKNPQATHDAVQNGWYHTGDLGYLDNEGFLYIIDRKKDMIIRGGQNIYPAEVENVLYQHPDVVECAVIGVPHTIYGEEVAAVIVKKAGALLDGERLRLFAKDRIASYKLPVHYHFVDELPHNASGKILKRDLRAMARDGIL